MDKHLHIISLTVPYPVDYGGVFDLFYKLQALQAEGIKIHLHCFKYGRDEQEILKQYCETVYYYPRKTVPAALSLKYPYIVKSRSNRELANMIAKDDHPILMEGVHCTWLLNDKRFRSRNCFVRLHNVEHIYYRHLYRVTRSPLKKLYYLWESFLLNKYERQISKKATFFAVTEKDAGVYKKLGCKEVYFLPLFLPPWKIKKIEGSGTFCLYQGDLSVAENEKAAKWLLSKVFNDLNIPFVIAGKNPSSSLSSVVLNRNSVCLVANPTWEEMQDLIEKAQVHLIPSFNATGIKIKLLNTLFNGRHCIVNEATVEGTGLENACVIAKDSDSFKKATVQLYQKNFCETESQLRNRLLNKLFDNKKNAEKLGSLIWRSDRV